MLEQTIALGVGRHHRDVPDLTVTRRVAPVTAACLYPARSIVVPMPRPRMPKRPGNRRASGDRPVTALM